jgi:hypothetical protein
MMEWAQLVNDPPLLAITIAIKLLEGANPSSHTVPCEPQGYALTVSCLVCRLVPCLCAVTSLPLPESKNNVAFGGRGSEHSWPRHATHPHCFRARPCIGQPSMLLLALFAVAHLKVRCTQWERMESE